MATQKTKEELIQEAFENVITGDESKMAYAVMLLKKARGITLLYSKHSELHIDLYIKFIEVLSGIMSSKKEISNSILNNLFFEYGSINVQSALNLGKIEIDGNKINQINFEGKLSDFFQNDLHEYWIKSLKYDALIKQISDWEEDSKADKEKLNKIKEIIGN